MELRAAVALARHWRDRSRAGDARTLLADAYAWFEGRPATTPEIASAGRLLAELTS